MWVVLLAGCGAEVRSEDTVPEVVEVLAVTVEERPTLVERGEDGESTGGAVPPETPAGNAGEAAEVATPVERTAPVRDVAAERAAAFERAERVQAAEQQRTSVPLVATDGEGQMLPEEPGFDQGLEDDGLRDFDEGLQEFEEGPSVPFGREIVLAIERTVTTEEDVAGDVFYAEILDDVLADDGLVLLHRGARLRGRVLASEPSDDADLQPFLELAIESLVWEGGERPVNATVLDADIEIHERDSGQTSAVKVLTGAAAGAILGRILGGDDKDAVKGGVVGAAAGAAVAAGTRGGHAMISRGGRIRVRLDERLLVS